MENDANDFTPRAYQIDLYEIALKENTIVYLPTGTGKTFIAIMLIKELSADIRKPYSEGGKHSVFVVNTVQLVTQQSEYIRRLTGLSCGAFSGEIGIDFWDADEWAKQLKEHQVLVMTSQILVDAISHGFIFINRINLIIFDECHRAVNDHPMRQVMRYFESVPKEQQPRVLGLTASILNSNVKSIKIASIIQSLERTFHAKVATINSVHQIKIYHASVKETISKFDEYVIPAVGKRVNDIINEMNKILECVFLRSSIVDSGSSSVFEPKSVNQKLANTLCDVQTQLKHAGIYGANKSILLHLIQLEQIKKSAGNVETTYVMEYLISELTKCRKLLENEMKDDTEMKRIYNYSSDQIRKLFAVLKDFNNNRSNNQTFCCIVFVERRFTAKVLYQILKNLCEHDEEFKFLQPEFLIGFSNNPYKNSKESLCISKWNKEALQRFRNGSSNCIVATDAIDEGVDIPKCSLIVKYDLPMNIRAYIQSKGRARYADSQYTILLQSDDTKFLSKYEEFKNIELHLQQLLVNNTDRKVPTENEIKDELYKCDIEPYVVIDKDGVKSTLTEQSVVSIISMYCSMLSNSKFGHLVPIWKKYEISNGTLENNSKLYKVSLQLPSVSPLKTVIFGDPMNSLDTAKRSVAMKTCIELHKIGELSDRLIPNTVESFANSIASMNLLPHWVDEDESETALVGTYKKKRHHQLQFPSALYGAFPLPKKLTYLHLLHAKPVYSTPHDDNRHLVFYNLLSNRADFGILSAKQMPEIPSFPIFMNVGELNVDVKVNYATMHLSEEEIGYIKDFHTLMFNEIVPVIKSFMVFDNYNLDNCFLIVPVDENWEINWKVIRQYQCIECIPAPVPFHFKNSDYELALVIPDYRATADVYIVTQVCEDLTPGSCFPTDNFFSYAHYYKQKHSVVINDLKQPMLEVKPISKKINCIKYRHMQFKKRVRTELPKDLKEHLVPELCTRIKFPALYWLKTTMLPSILHRVSQLLIAEDLRHIIAVEIGLGSLSSDSKWPPLEITDEEREESFEPSIEVPIDENVESSQPEPVLSGPEINVLNTEAYHYPWTKDQEPPNLCKNIEEIQMIQIEHYYQFMSGDSDVIADIMKSKKVNFMNKPSVPVPPLEILLLKDSCGPSPVQIMYALTSKLGHDAFDLERLETLGDSYLKFIVSLFVYDKFPNYSEGPLSAIKQQIIGNRNLYYCGCKKHIPGRMKVDHFIPFSNFIPPAYAAFRELQKLLLDAEVSPNVLYEIQIPKKEQYTGCVSEVTKNIMQDKVLNWEPAELQTGMEHFLGIQTVSDKTVADCVEALIGVYLISMGIKHTSTLLQWFEILPKEYNVNALLFDSPEILVTSELQEKDINYFMPWASDIETKLGYKFQNRAFLLQAFTHPSYAANNITECYERLEFLGDGILDFLITCYIYENCGNLNPGALTDLRSALVNNITFACLAVRHGLHTALLAYAPKLNDAIDNFVKFQEERDHAVNDELLWVLLDEDECNISEYVDVPKVLGDLFESAIAAIYMDSGKDLTKVWEIVYSIMHKEIAEFSKNIPKQPVRVLFETPGARPVFLDAVPIEGTCTCMVPLQVVIAGKVKLFHGLGANKKQAKCAAAKQALKSLLCKT